MKSTLEKITSERDNALRERTEAVAQIQEIQMKMEAKENNAEVMKKEMETQMASVSSLEDVAKRKDEGITDLQAQL